MDALRVLAGRGKEGEGKRVLGLSRYGPSVLDSVSVACLGDGVLLECER